MSKIAFVGLNALDAWLTGQAIAMGATELNPLMSALGGSLFWKICIGVAVVLGLRFWGKDHLALPLSLGMFAVVVWNLTMCFILYLSNQAPLHAQITNGLLQQPGW